MYEVIAHNKYLSKTWTEHSRKSWFTNKCEALKLVHGSCSENFPCYSRESSCPFSRPELQSTPSHFHLCSMLRSLRHATSDFLFYDVPGWIVKKDARNFFLIMQFISFRNIAFFPFAPAAARLHLKLIYK